SFAYCSSVPLSKAVHTKSSFVLRTSSFSCGFQVQVAPPIADCRLPIADLLPFVINSSFLNLPRRETDRYNMRNTLTILTLITFILLSSCSPSANDSRKEDATADSTMQSTTAESVVYRTETLI